MIITPPESEEPATMAVLDDSAAVVVAPADAPSTAGAGSTGPPGLSDLAERCIWSVVWLGVVSGGFQLWGSWSAWSFGGLASPLLVLIGIAGLVAVWLVGSPRSPVMQVGALAMVVVVDGQQRGVRDPHPPLLQHGLGCLQPGGGPAFSCTGRSLRGVVGVGRGQAAEGPGDSSGPTR